MKSKNNFPLLITTFSVILTLLFIYMSFNSDSNSKFYSKNDDSIKKPIEITETGNEILIDIKGNIHQPGVYKLKQDDRLNDLISLSGGFNNANEYCYNLAQKLTDGTQIIIKSANEPCETSTLININTANIDELTRIKGIGPGRASSIIEHRNKKGLFNSIDDIKNVTGIGEGTFEKLKDQITV
jgi:competence protein ComEA